jgi:hypothetical protein
MSRPNFALPSTFIGASSRVRFAEVAEVRRVLERHFSGTEARSGIGEGT